MFFLILLVDILVEYCKTYYAPWKVNRTTVSPDLLIEPL